MSTTTNEAQPQRVGALLPVPSCLGIGEAPQWVPARTPTVHWGPNAGRPWVAHTNAPRAKYRLNDACTSQLKTQVRQTKMVAEQVTTTDQLMEKTVEVPKGKDAYNVAQEKYKKQMMIRIK